MKVKWKYIDLTVSSQTSLNGCPTTDTKMKRPQFLPEDASLLWPCQWVWPQRKSRMVPGSDHKWYQLSQKEDLEPVKKLKSQAIINDLWVWMHKLYLRIWLKRDMKDLCERVAYRGAMVHSQSESQIPDTKKHGPIGEPGWHPRWPFDLLHNLLTPWVLQDSCVPYSRNCKTP